MTLLDRLDDRFGRYGMPQVTLALVLAQVVVYFLMKATPPQPGEDEPLVLRLFLIPDKVLEGEVWRLFTFMVIPPLTNPIFAFFFWYLFYLMGTALEQYWGTFRYNIFLLIGYVATVASAFINPDTAAQNGFVQGSVFLAFAYLYPDFELMIFFVLPVKIKWLALITWIGYGLTVLVGDWSTRAMVLASVANFLIFFAPDLYQRMRSGRWWMAYQARQFAQSNKPYHTCTVCGITDKSHPQMEFRYCSKCDGTHGYCSHHLRNHEHIVSAEKKS